MDRESPELIERQMEETRESLTEKVSLLEQQVVGTIQSATDAVQDTVHSVKTAVEDTMTAVSGGVRDSVESVSEGVKEALDISGKVRKHPLPMVGGAVAVGLITSWLVFRRTSTPAPAQIASTNYVPIPAPVSASAPVAAQRPGWLNDLFDIAGRELKKLAEHAIARASSSVQKSVEEGIPKLIDRAMPEMSPAGAQCGNGRLSRSELSRQKRV